MSDEEFRQLERQYAASHDYDTLERLRGSARKHNICLHEETRCYSTREGVSMGKILFVLRCADCRKELRREIVQQTRPTHATWEWKPKWCEGKKRRTRTRYRRNSDADLRKLERDFSVSGDRGTGLCLAAGYQRVGRKREAQELRDSLWTPVSLDLDFLHDIEVTGWAGDWYGVGSGQARDGYPIVGLSEPLITATDFVDEWIMAEYGSWEDHGMPEEGHVVNILDREPKYILQINAFSEIGDLIMSLSSNTAGLNYGDATGEQEIIFDDLTVSLPELYGDMSSEVISRLRQLERDFLAGADL